MKMYRCDICGREMVDNDPYSCYAEKVGIPYPSHFGAMLRGKDICPRCIEIGKLIDFGMVLTMAWKEEVKKLESCNKIDYASIMKEGNDAQ